MKFSSTCIAVSAALMPQLISAHMRITDPAPYNGEDNAPLAADGSNFPCMLQGGAQAMQAAKTYTAGKPGNFKVTGGATHGGGSCQLSITYDNPPTKNSKFKVIQSWVGGCPVASNDQNLSNDRNDNSIPPFQFNMPNLHNGTANLVWTWFNRIGNREMYMNCAPINIQSDSEDDSTYNGLPDMFKANIGSVGQCTTTEGQDIIFPDECIGENVDVGKGNCNFKQACPSGSYSFKPGQPGEQKGVSSPGGGSSSGGSQNGGSQNGGSQNGGSQNGGQYSQAPAPTGSYTQPSSPALVDTGNNSGSPVNSSPSSQYTSINGGNAGSSDNSGSYNNGGNSQAPAQPSMSATPSTPSTGGSYTGGNNSQSPSEDDNTGMFYGSKCGDGKTPVVCDGAPQGKFIECYGNNPYGKPMGFAQPIPGGYNGCEDFKTKCGQGSASQKFKRHAFEHAKRFARRHLH